MAHDHLTDDPVDLQNTFATPPRSKPASRGGGQTSLLVLTGSAFAVIGLALAIAPLVSSGAAEFLTSLSNVGVLGGTLFAGGLLVVGMGVLRRGQSAVIAALEVDNGDSGLIEEVANGIVEVRHALDHIHRVHGELQQELRSLRGFCEAEANKPMPMPAPAANDSQGEAVFRLAASLDKVGAKIEERMKAQFSNLRERLDGVEANFQETARSIEQRVDQFTILPDSSGSSSRDWEASQHQAPTWDDQQPSHDEGWNDSEAQPEPSDPEPMSTDSPLGVLDMIEPDEPQSAPRQGDFSQGLDLQQVSRQQQPAAALPEPRANGPWGGELQLSTPEANLSPEDRERMLAETRLRQSLQNMQRNPGQGSQDYRN